MKTEKINLENLKYLTDKIFTYFCSKLNMNSRAIKSTIVMLSLLLWSAGCGKDNEMNNNEINSEEFCSCVNVNVDSEINIRMVEIFDKSPRTFQFQCFTEKIYPCVNYPIIVVSQQSSNNIDISFKGVIETDFCFTALGPASAYIYLGTLNNGMYN
jgi:hypothetical protein